MQGLKELKAVLDEFNKNYPRPNMPELEISEVYDLDTDWTNSYPNASLPGIYVIFDEEGCLLYIGKASRKNVIGRRLSAYFGHDDKGGWKLHKPDEWKSYGKLKYIITIPLPVDRAFEAPAIEEYLITRLKPKAGG
jgi:hypothetical protein